MLRNKRILLIIILAVALFLIPNMCNAETTDAKETTTTSTGKIVKWSYELKDGAIINLKCTNVLDVSGELTIPSTIDGYNVTHLGDNSFDMHGIFYDCKGLTGVVIPDTVTTIGVGAFKGCVGLRNVTIPNSITSIKNYAFNGCTSVDFNIPDSVTSIGDFAFEGCVKMNLTIPNSVTSIGRYAFADCTGAKNIKLSSNLTTIGEYAFKGCVGIKTLTIPGNVTNIGEGTFLDCSALSSITLSENLTSIQDRTFEGCTSLKNIVIPESVAIIKSGNWENIYGVFGDCINLEKILIPDTVVSIEGNVFRNCPKLTIYGNDGQASKTYAENNKVKFDYIANWDKANSGTDIAKPTVKEMEIICNNLSTYYDSNSRSYKIPSNTQIAVKVTFSEEITGKTAPTLVINCGAGKDITLTNGEISSPIITYAYTIKAEDKGQIAVKSFSGGNITDLVGNEADLTPTKLGAGYLGTMTAYANGSVSNQSNNNNQNQGTTVTLSSISITKTPTRNTYTEGDSFEKTGMVITATYSDGSTKEITNYTISPSGALKTTDTKVVISYTENGVTKTVEQKITVLKKGVNNNDNNTNDNSTSKDDTTKDTTIKNDNKLPQTGTTVLTLVLICLIAVAVISKVKVGKYKDI